MDYSGIKAGETDPLLGKTIKDIILAENSYIVYIDTDDVIQWSTSGHSTFGENFGGIQNKISYWESICNKLFSKQDSYEYKCLLAEGYARMLDGGNSELANQILNQTSSRIEKHGKEILRQDYILSSLCFTTILLISLLIISSNKNAITQIWDSNTIEIYITGIFGSIGAFVSTMIRSQNYNSDITLGRQIHQIDGMLRIIYGFIAGILIALGIKANLIFGFINNTNTTVFTLLFLGAISGASEIILPNIIKQIENQ